jgi:lysophospholipase L1-like esterase
MSCSTKRLVVGAAIRVVTSAALAASLSACGDGASAPVSGVDGSGAPPASVPAEAPAPVSPAAPPAMSPATAAPSPNAEGNPLPAAVSPPAGMSPPADNGAAAPAGNSEPEPVVPPADGTTPPPTAPIDPVVGPDPDAATRARCTGVNPIECHFGGQPGNYEVTVVLGGSAAASTTVLAETRRTLLGAVTTAAGATRRFTFGVNVRQPEGEPIQAVPAGTPGLDLYFVGAAGEPPALESIGFRPAQAPVVVYVAGDSTVADQTGVDYGGWGQQLPQHFAHPVVVANYSDSGESSGSFLNARPLFATIESQLTAKDWVLIQFGHNDKQVAAADFRANISQLVTRVKARGASPVLITPVARAQFNGGDVAVQHINGLGANLPDIIRQVAAEQSVPLLDLTARTSERLREVGPNGWQPFHALGTDATHTNDAGARVTAGFVRELLIQAGVEPLVRQLR